MGKVTLYEDGDPVGSKRLEAVEAYTTGADRVGSFNDKKNQLRFIRESDRFILAGGKAHAPTPAKGPKVPHSLVNRLCVQHC
jgi:hypothetical protein